MVQQHASLSHMAETTLERALAGEHDAAVTPLDALAAARARRDARGTGAAYIADTTELYLSASVGFAPLRRFLEQDPEYALKVMASKHSPMQRRSIAATREVLAEQVAKGALDPPLDLEALAYLIV